MTPITKETLEAAGWVVDRSGEYDYALPGSKLSLWLYQDNTARVLFEPEHITSIEQIAEVCRLPNVPS